MERNVLNTDLSGKVAVVTGALLFLVNDKAASFVNGICILGDCGFSAYSGV